MATGMATAITGLEGDAKRSTTDLGNAILFGVPTSFDVTVINIYVIVVNGATGNVQLRWAQNTSSADATTVASKLLSHR